MTPQEVEQNLIGFNKIDKEIWRIIWLIGPIRKHKWSPDFYIIDDDNMIELQFHDGDYGSWEESFPVYYLWSSDDVIKAYEQQRVRDMELAQQREDAERAERYNEELKRKEIEEMHRLQKKYGNQ